MFPDGFPLAPIDAIKFSANFGSLTPQEEQDWYKWLETASPDQQKELVDTLHQIYASHHLNQPESTKSQNQNDGQNEQFSNQNFSQNSNQNQPNNQSNFQPQNQSQNNFNQNQSQNQPPNQFQNNLQPQNLAFSDQFNQSNSQPNNQPNSQNQFNPNQSNNQNPQFNPQFQNQQPSTFDNSQGGSGQNQFENSTNFGQENEQFRDRFGNNGQSFTQDNTQDKFNKSGNFPTKSNQNPVSSLEKQEFGNPKTQNESKKLENSQTLNNSSSPSSSDNPYANQKDFAQQFDQKPENPSEESFLNLANSKYTPNPILEDHSPEPSEFTFSDELENEKLKKDKKIEKVEPSFVDFAKENSSNNYDENEKSGDDFVFVEAPKPEKTPPKPETFENKKMRKNKIDQRPETKDEEFSDDFSFTAEDSPKIEEKTEVVKKPLYSAPEKNDLEDLYKLYINSQKKNLEDDQEFKARQAILQDDAHQKQVSFWDKVMQVISNYEQMADNVLLMNEQIIRQAKEIQILKNSTQARSGASLQDQINSLRYDLERVIREFDDYRAENYRRQKDMSEQVAAATADTYKTDGMLQKLDLLANRLTRMETQR